MLPSLVKISLDGLSCLWWSAQFDSAIPHGVPEVFWGKVCVPKCRLEVPVPGECHYRAQIDTVHDKMADEGVTESVKPDVPELLHALHRPLQSPQCPAWSQWSIHPTVLPVGLATENRLRVSGLPVQDFENLGLHRNGALNLPLGRPTLLLAHMHHAVLTVDVFPLQVNQFIPAQSGSQEDEGDVVNLRVNRMQHLQNSPTSP